MRLHVAAVGQRMPRWVTEGWVEYTRRMPAALDIRLKEIALARRGRHADLRKIRQQEGEALVAAIPGDAFVVALDMRGKPWSTDELAERMQHWMTAGRDVCFLIGGPDGFSPECLQRADTSWSLSPLTLPHTLVRVVLAEQLYRAWTILGNHPYHRG